MNEIEITKLGNLRAIFPAETARVFFDRKGVSAPQKHSDFSKKMYSKNNHLFFKKPLGAFNQEL